MGNITKLLRIAGLLVGGLAAGTAAASDLTYTYMDFQALDNKLDGAGLQQPVPNQTVRINTRSGDGIAVAGSMKIGGRFYVGGHYESSVIDVDAVIASPLTTVAARDTFDLVGASLEIGYLWPIGERLDLIGEIGYDSSNYDFGSFAGENFDIDDAGVAARAGVRWNPTPPLELFAFGRYSQVGEANLSTREYDAGTTVNAGLRWYVLDDLGIGFEMRSGDVDTAIISMRFSFGNLPW